MAKYQDFLSRVGSNRDRAALRGIFSMFLTDDNPPKLKDLELASIILSGVETTQITISGASTTGILQSGTSTTAYSITGAFTTGINIAADGTTAIAVTSAFSGTNAISLAGTAATAGLNISGDHTTGITIGAQTTAGLAITGNTVNGIRIDRATYTNAAMQIGAFAASLAAGSAIVFSSTCTTALRVYGESIADLTSAYNFRSILGRNLVSCVADTVINQETYGVTGQVVVKNGSMNHYHAGVLGTFESGTLCHVQTGYGCAAVMGRVGATNTTVESGGLLAGVMAVQNTATWTVTGTAAGFATKKTAAGVAWPIGLYMAAGDVTQGIRIGNWAGSGTAGSAIAISAATDAADTTQRNLVAIYGESTTDLTSGVHANIGRFRHLVVGSSLQVNHETYGLVGQVVGKSASLLHMHAGLMGTLEANTTALVCNGAYAYSVAAVIARIGGTNLITATKPVAGFSAIHNGAALASGDSIAYAACATSTGNWSYLLGADNCDNILYVATGTDYECGVKVATQLTGNAYPKMDGIIRIYVGATAYYVPFYAAENIDNE